MDEPARMLSTRQVAVVAVFSAVIVATNFALTDLLNVKLMDTLVFVAAFVYGFRTGALVGISSELIWSVVSPWGSGGYIIPFLVLGELLYAAAGSIAASIWNDNLQPFSISNLAIGSLMTICAFVWDFETNIGTALIAFWPNVTVSKILATEFVTGGIFMIVHELSDFLLGLSVAPIIIVYLIRLRNSHTRPIRREILAGVRN
jgi:hypothetical protein